MALFYPSAETRRMPLLGTYEAAFKSKPPACSTGSFAEKGRSRLLARIDGLHDRGDWKANETREIAAE